MIYFQKILGKVCKEANLIVQQYKFNIYEIVFLANLLCFLRMGECKPLEDPESFKQCVEETERLFFMFHNNNGFQPESAAKRWSEILSVANSIVDLTDESVLGPLIQLLQNNPNDDSVFLQAFTNANPNMKKSHEIFIPARSDFYHN